MKYLGHSFRRNESLTLCISEIIKLTTTGHCFLDWTKAVILVHYRCKKEVDRTGKKHVYFINTDEIPYQVSFTPNTWYLHEWKISVTMVTINLAFVRAVKTTKNYEPNWPFCKTYGLCIVGNFVDFRKLVISRILGVFWSRFLHRNTLICL